MYYQEPERKRGKYFNFYKKIKQGLVLTISLFCLVLIFYSNFKYQGEVVFLDQTTPNMIQRISEIFERKPLISKEI